MYDIIFYEKARNSFDKLPADLKGRILSVFERIKFRPFHFIKRKQGTPYFILRIGEYRAILDISQKESIIYVIEVGHRKNIYD